MVWCRNKTICTEWEWQKGADWLQMTTFLSHQQHFCHQLSTVSNVVKILWYVYILCQPTLTTKSYYSCGSFLKLLSMYNFSYWLCNDWLCTVYTVLKQSNIEYRKPIRRNVYHCCSFHGLQRFDLYCINKKRAWYVAQQSLSPVSDKLNIITELLHVKFNYMQLSLLNRAKVDFMLYCLCTL